MRKCYSKRKVLACRQELLSHNDLCLEELATEASSGAEESGAEEDPRGGLEVTAEGWNVAPVPAEPSWIEKRPEV